MILLRLLALLIAAITVPASAQTFPPFTGYVVDNANLLPPAVEQQLTAKLQALQQSTQRQLVVATIADLQGYPIEDYGYRLGRTWGVGMRDVDNGIILIVAPNDRKVRIEVGYGLTPVITDALSSVIIQQAILPRFRAGDMAGGVVAGADALLAQLRAPDAEARAKVAAAEAARREEANRGQWVPLVFWAIVFLVILIFLFRGGGGGGGRRFRRGGAPVVIWGPGGGWSSGGGLGGGGLGGGFGGGGGGSFGGGGASGSW